MLSKTRGIVLHIIPYNDKYVIVHIYTELFGRVSYMVPRQKGKKSAVSKALFMPLSVLEMEVDHQPKRDIQRIKECRSCYLLNSLSFDPVKNVLALFLSELLYRSIKETEPDRRLFQFLYGSIHYLEHTEDGIANFHIVFMMNLLHYLGVFPRGDTYRSGFYFDLLSGTFRADIPMHTHFLTPEDSLFFYRLLRISFENMSLYAFSRSDRRNIIRKILEYYQLHLPGFSGVHSLDVLETLFD
ncbi:DNA repair protein RecO [Parabacteroides sp. OttesenSCG-928-J18]|nr:DNA repair protein RecO [Parabacteroides sp. OttesenSCG-928-J18]